MSFTLGKHLRFIDSFQFMSSSSVKLVGNLSDEAFIYTKQEFNEKEFIFMKKKGVYPFDFMDSFDKFDNTELPKKEDFYSLFDNQHITEEQQNTLRKFGKPFQ